MRWTLPNFLTLARICLTPVIALLPSTTSEALAARKIRKAMTLGQYLGRGGRLPRPPA